VKRFLKKIYFGKNIFISKSFQGFGKFLLQKEFELKEFWKEIHTAQIKRMV
jgi:hypothetical protein